MPVELENRGKALEDEYFRRKEQELITNMKRKLVAEGKETEMKCPRCNSSLKETDFEGVTIDICGDCHGVWLDAGELAQLNEKERHERGWFHRLLG